MASLSPAAGIALTPQVVCSSRVSHVAVYARGAVITREVMLPTGATPSPSQLPSGEVELIIEELTPLAEPGSFRATLHTTTDGSVSEVGLPNRQILSVRSSLHVPETTATPGPSAARLETLLNSQQRAQAELERLLHQRRQITKSIPDPALRSTSLIEKVDERIADALATAELLSETQAALDERLALLELELATLQSAIAAAELAQKQSRSAEHLGSDRGQPTRRAVITLSPAAVAGGTALIGCTLSYVVPAARFWPRYTLRIVESRDGNRDLGRRATWLIEALVAQRTGEDWQQARLSLSTADLLLDARLPELPSLRLGRAQPAARRGYRPPPGGLDELYAGYDTSFGGSSSTAQPPPGRPAFAEEETAGDSDDDGSPASEESFELTLSADDLRAEPEEALRPKSGRAALSRSQRAPAPGGPPPTVGGRAAPAPPSVSFGAPPMTLGAMPAPQSPMRDRRVGSSGRGGIMKKQSELATTLAEEGGAYGGGGGSASDGSGGSDEPSSLEPQDTWLDFDRLVLAKSEDRSRRGRLIRTLDSAHLTNARFANEQLEALHPGDGLRDPQESRGHFDHRYDAAGLVLIPSDGLPHRVLLSSSETVPTMRLIAVPRERPEVYREAELKNPSEAPLLAGPVDVYFDGSLLTTAAIAPTDRGGSLSIGMGVEDRLRIARNVRSDEETIGLLGGSTQVSHHVSIELSSALGQQCLVEVLERLPVSDDKSLTIELISARPEAKEYSQAERGSPLRGGLVFRLLLPPGGKGKIEYQYRVTFPARTEIVGGNRRD